MFPWFHELKLEEAGEGSGGGAALLTNPENIRVELGIPHEVGDEPEPKAPPVKKEDPVDPRLKGMETELAATRRQLAEVQASERYWAKQAQTKVDPDDEEDAGAGRPVVQDELVTETAEQFLDDVSKRGMKAIKERGFLTKAEAQQMVNDGLAAANENLHAARVDATFDGQLASEFPEIAADGKRIAAGQEPQTEIYKRAAVNFREMVALDPSLKNSKSALIMAARTAKAQLTAEGKSKPTVNHEGDDDDNRQTRRRNRIDNQRTERAPAAGSLEGDDSPVLTDQQKEVMRHLKVDEAAFVKNSDGGRRGR